MEFFWFFFNEDIVSEVRERIVCGIVLEGKMLYYCSRHILVAGCGVGAKVDCLEGQCKGQEGEKGEG